MVWRNGRASVLRSRGRGFDSRWDRYQVTTLGKLPYAKRLEILGLDAFQKRRIKSDLVLCCSIICIVHGHSCMKAADFFVLRNTSITRGRNLKLIN